jgi:hypothetical protein
MVYLILVTINVWHVIVLNLWNKLTETLQLYILLLSIGDFTKHLKNFLFISTLDIVKVQ